ncbi:Ig-like domain-containing protein [Hymenobacter segetis]
MNCLVGIDNVRIQVTGCYTPPTAVVSPSPLCGTGNAIITCTTPGTLPSGLYFRVYKRTPGTWTDVQVGNSAQGVSSFTYSASCPVSTLNSIVTEDYYVSIAGSNSESDRTLARVTWYPQMTAPVVSWQYPIGILNRPMSLLIGGAAPTGTIYNWNGPGPLSPPSTSYTPTSSSANFNITATAPSGCSAISSLSLVSFPLDVPSVSACGTVAIPLQIPASYPALPSGYQYQWYDGTGTAQGTSYTATYTAATHSSGTRTVEVSIVGPSGTVTNAESERLAIQLTWNPEVIVPVITATPPIALSGQTVAIAVSSSQANVRYDWTGPAIITTPPTGNQITSGPLTANSATFIATGIGLGACHAESVPLTLPIFPLVVNDQVACAPTTITIQLATLAVAGYEYRWYTAVTGGQRLTASGTSYDALYSAAGVTGNRTIYVCIANTSSNAESDRLAIQLTWHPVPPNPVSGGFTPTPIVRGTPVTPVTYSPVTTSYTYVWDWKDNTAPSPPPHTYTVAGNYRVELLVTDNSPQACATTYYFDLKVTDLLCETYLPAQGMQLAQNPINGTFTFISTCAPTTGTTPRATYGEARIVFDCLSGMPTPELFDPRQAVAASAQSLQPAVVPADGSYGVTTQALTNNPFLSGAGYLQPQAGYSWSSPLSRDVNKSSGRFTPRPFAWELSAPNRMRSWVPAGQATRYTPNGDGVEETNALGTPSAVRLGYRGRALPYITAQNATYASLVFESFESAYEASTVAAFEDGTPIGQAPTGLTDICAHAGRRSLLLPAAGQSLPAVAGLPADWTRSGLRLLVWVRVAAGASAAVTAPALATTSWWAGTGTFPLYAEVVSAGTTSRTSGRVALELVGQSGEWSLCQVTIPGTFLRSAAATAPTSTTVRLGWTGNGSSSYTVWIDDVRLQPSDAQATAYVYDPASLRLLASFDDQHFGMYYQYDTEGRLVRKIVETERGRKTVQETLYSTPKTAKIP